MPIILYECNYDGTKNKFVFGIHFAFTTIHRHFRLKMKRDLTFGGVSKSKSLAT